MLPDQTPDFEKILRSKLEQIFHHLVSTQEMRIVSAHHDPALVVHHARHELYETIIGPMLAMELEMLTTFQLSLLKAKLIEIANKSDRAPMNEETQAAFFAEVIKFLNEIVQQEHEMIDLITRNFSLTPGQIQALNLCIRHADTARLTKLLLDIVKHDGLIRTNMWYVANLDAATLPNYTDPTGITAHYSFATFILTQYEHALERQDQVQVSEGQSLEIAKTNMITEQFWILCKLNIEPWLKSHGVSLSTQHKLALEKEFEALQQLGNARSAEDVRFFQQRGENLFAFLVKVTSEN